MKLLMSKKRRRDLIKKEGGLEFSAGLFLEKKAAPENINFACNGTFELNRIPLKEMKKLGWIEATNEEILGNPEIIVSDFLSSLNTSTPVAAICRRTICENSNKSMDKYALIAWTAQILNRAKKQVCKTPFRKEILSEKFLNKIARLSSLENGPVRAARVLADYGIKLIVERHLSHTYLDGGTVFSEDGFPVVGLTIRYDRFDNFWFTLLHELVHVWRHLKDQNESFVDSFDPENVNYAEDQREREANKYAREAFIPRSVWKRSDAYITKTPEAIIELAQELEISPAIVAGRIQREFDMYRNPQLRAIVDQGSVREFFPDLYWGRLNVSV